ncbi:MAG: ABC transporter ATP-binding protein [Acetobacteraceae bacterium]|nr:ABC transporter ATP-binding protein [Acetobacteraceae bacterium]
MSIERQNSAGAAAIGEPVLELRDLTKSFGETEIIRGVNLTVKRGQRHGLIGPNGAGKSTLFNLISGHYVPSSGEILLNRQSIAGLQPHVINRRGLSRSFQITNLFPRMSVAENLRISIMGRHGHRFTLFRAIRALNAVNTEVDEFLDRLRLSHRRDELAGDLAYSEQRALEMGMSLATDPEVLLLDEPTAGMSREETAYIVDLIRRVTEGRTLLVVEHDMSVVFTLCDQVSVLVYGEVIASGEPAVVRADTKVQEAYLGEEVH